MDCPWNSPGQNTGVGSLALLQGIFPTWGSNPALPHCRRILYQLSHQGSPILSHKGSLSSPGRWANHLSHPSSLIPRHTVTLTPCKEQARPPPLTQRARKGTCCLSSLPPAIARAPTKPCLNFSSGFWSWWERPGILVRNSYSLLGRNSIGGITLRTRSSL